MANWEYLMLRVEGIRRGWGRRIGKALRCLWCGSSLADAGRVAPRGAHFALRRFESSFLLAG